MSKLPYFPFYNQDWLSSPKVRLMTDAQEGIYVHLLASAWDFPDTFLPVNRKILQRLCPRSKWKNIKFVLHSCFLCDVRGYVNPRLADLSRHSREVVASASYASKYRWNKEKHDANALQGRNAIQNQTQNHKEKRQGGASNIAIEKATTAWETAKPLINKIQEDQQVIFDPFTVRAFTALGLKTRTDILTAYKTDNLPDRFIQKYSEMEIKEFLKK